MEPESNITPLADLDLTERELRHLAAAWLCCTGGDNIDFDTFTTLTKHPNSVNARKRFGEIKRKVRAQVFGAKSVAASSSPVKNGASTKRKHTGGKSTPPTKPPRTEKQQAKGDDGNHEGGLVNAASGGYSVENVKLEIKNEEE